MLDFQPLELARREEYDRCLAQATERGCACSFNNLFLWGRQRAAFVGGFLVIFAQFGQRSIYTYPMGTGDVGPVLEAIITDARERGILCRLACLTAQDCMDLEERYPGRFRFYPDRDSCDYVYKIEDLAALKGKKFQKKRNHLNKFRQNHPHCRIQSITWENADAAQAFVADWYAARQAADPMADFHLEQRAIRRAFAHRQALGMEGLILEENGAVLAMTLGSRLSPDTFDIHFEKAREDVDGAYPAINQAFAAWLQEKYPELQFLNREDDMGIPGLRQAKLSYNPDHLVVKFWARLWEDSDED